MTTPIHQEITFDAPPEQIYRALMDSAQHAEFTGGPAQVSEQEGGACSWHGGKIVGRNLELRPGQRIVQAWRAAHWDEGVYSVIRYELRAQGEGTTVVFDQAGHPEGSAEHLTQGWHERYWTPLRAYLGRS